MTRQERRAINRANAKLSTGPASPEGKLTSSANATTHGLTSMRPYLPSEEQDYKTYYACSLRRLSPQTDAEHNLATTIIDLEWRLKRIPTLEARLFADEEADAFKIIRALDTLSRHEVRLRKLLASTLLQLNDLAQNRPNQQQTEPLQANGFVLNSAEPTLPAMSLDTQRKAPDRAENAAAA